MNEHQAAELIREISQIRGVLFGILMAIVWITCSLAFWKK